MSLEYGYLGSGRIHFENASNVYRLPRYARKLLKIASITGHFGFVFEEHWGREITWWSLVRTAPFSKYLPSTLNEKPAFSNSSCKKSVFEKLRFLDVFVWMVGLTVEITLRFQISAAWCGRCGSRSSIIPDTSSYVKLSKYQFIIEIRDSGILDSFLSWLQLINICYSSSLVINILSWWRLKLFMQYLTFVANYSAPSHVECIYQRSSFVLCP